MKRAESKRVIKIYYVSIELLCHNIVSFSRIIMCQYILCLWNDYVPIKQGFVQCVPKSDKLGPRWIAQAMIKKKT